MMVRLIWLILVLWHFIGQGNYMKKIFFIIISILIFSPVVVSAAELYFDDRIAEIGIGQTAEIGVFIDTENQTINAIEGTVRVDPNFEVRAITLSNSFIPLWIEQPQITPNRTIKFSGIVPGGFTDSYGLLFSLVLEARIPGEAGVYISKPRVLAHDGLGSAVDVTTRSLLIDIGLTNKDIRSWNALDDTTPPENFFPEIVRDSSMFDNQWFVIFNTQDKESGIDYYEIQETDYFDLNKLTNSNDWQRAVSPYILSDQSRSSYVVIKAVDKNGNFRIVRVQPQNHEKNYTNKKYLWYQLAIWTILIVGFVYILYIFFRKKDENVS